MVAAPEPTDIIWENRGYTDNDRINKKILVTIIIFFLLSVSFVTNLKLNQLAQAHDAKYPMVPCDNFLDEYNMHEDKWKKDAIRQYILNGEK